MGALERGLRAAGDLQSRVIALPGTPWRDSSEAHLCQIALWAWGVGIFLIANLCNSPLWMVPGEIRKGAEKAREVNVPL